MTEKSKAVGNPVADIKSRIDNPTLLAQRRDQLVQVTTHLFENQGFDATSVEDVAGQVGLTVGAIYRYIGRKEDLLVLILEDLMERYESSIAKALAGKSDPLDRLQSALTGYYRVIDAEGRKVLIAYRESKHLTDDGREWLKRRELETNRIFERIIADGIEVGVFQPVDHTLVTYNIIMLGHAWALKYWFFRDRMTIDEYIEKQSEWLFRDVIRPQAAH